MLLMYMYFCVCSPIIQYYTVCTIHVHMYMYTNILYCIQSEESRSLQEILDIIMTIVFKNGIRTTEFFCDHDKLKSGVITENQFVCGLLLCLGQNSQLSQTDIEKVVKSYQLSDGRIYYKDFCDLMENGKLKITYSQYSRAVYTIVC